MPLSTANKFKKKKKKREKLSEPLRMQQNVKSRDCGLPWRRGAALVGDAGNLKNIYTEKGNVSAEAYKTPAMRLNQDDRLGAHPKEVTL